LKALQNGHIIASDIQSFVAKTLLGVSAGAAEGKAGIDGDAGERAGTGVGETVSSAFWFCWWFPRRIDSK
jgi:hypothetical protein